MADILIVYGAYEFPMRLTSWAHLNCFRRYSQHRCYYLNIYRPASPWYIHVPEYITRTSFDAVIYFTDFMCLQWCPTTYDDFAAKVENLKNISGVKAAFNQDEHYHTDVLNRFINEFGINHVFSMANELEWSKIYPDVDRQKVSFHTALTGYLDDDLIDTVSKTMNNPPERDIDIGYRAYGNQQSLGRHGQLKIQLGHSFRDQAREFPLKTDISLKAEDSILGWDWYRFLMRCKYVIGMEGGSSILDSDGSLMARTAEYLKSHPDASFEEVEASCFPGRDGELDLKALSPRHLECCLTRTCQLLVEGRYNGVLEPWLHYIPVKSDAAGIRKTLDLVCTDELRREITENAYRDIVASNAYTYRAFVRNVTETLLAVKPLKNAQGLFRRTQSLRAWMLMFLKDVFMWFRLATACADRHKTGRLTALVSTAHSLAAVFSGSRR